MGGDGTDPPMNNAGSSLLDNVDFLGKLLNTEDIIAALLALGFSLKKSRMTMEALYAFLGSILGRLLSSGSFDGVIGSDRNVAALMASGQIQTDALLSALAQSGFETLFQKTRFLNAFERAAATQVIAKAIGAKFQGWASVGLKM